MCVTLHVLYLYSLVKIQGLHLHRLQTDRNPDIYKKKNSDCLRTKLNQEMTDNTTVLGEVEGSVSCTCLERLPPGASPRPP
jgi:hypothetical protein